MRVPKVLDPNAFTHSLRSPNSTPPFHPPRRATTLLTRPAQVVTAAGKKLKAAELNHIAAESANNETKRLVALGRGVAQSAWETSVGRIVQERNVTMKEATGDFATQTGEAKADFDSSFGACEAEKNRTSALVANDQASVARIKSLMLTLKDRGCNGQDMKKLTPLIPRPPEPTRAERIAILRQGQNGATAPTAPTPTLVVPTPATPAAPAAPFEPVLALLERGLRGGRAVPSETRKLNRLATAFHVKLMPKVDMVEARGGVDVETEDVVGYGHPMVRLPRTSTPACYGCTFVTLHFYEVLYTTQHFASHVRRTCLPSNAFAHTCSTPSSLRSLASLCSLPRPIRPQTRLLMLPPPSTPPLHSCSSGYAVPTHSLQTRSELAGAFPRRQTARKRQGGGEGGEGCTAGGAAAW